MTFCMEGAVAHLQGDLTNSGMTQSSIAAMEVSLREIETCGEKNVSIDCGRIRAADRSGLQMLYVWMQCARFRGVESELIHLSSSLQQAMLGMGLVHCFVSDGANP